MDTFPLYQGAGAQSPEEWLIANNVALVKFIAESKFLDVDDKMVCIELAVSHSVYKNLVIHIYMILKAENYDEGYLSELRDCMTSWKTWNTLTGLIRHQTVADRLQSFPGWNELRLRKLAALDVDALSVRLFTVINNRGHYRALSRLKNHEAQVVLNLLQTLLDSPSLDAKLRKLFVNGLLRLSRNSGLIPETLLQHQIQLDEGDPIAEGSFGELHTGIFCGRAVAIKLFKMYQGDDIAKYIKKASKETLIWRQLQHQNILPFMCLYYYPTNNHTKIGLVSPWMKNGNVKQFLRQGHDTDRISLILDIAEGLNYLHSMRPIIIHGDLKAVNILITDNHTACLADFGLSTISDTSIMSHTTRSHSINDGSLRWMAPELFGQDEESEVLHNTKTDIYAFGCVCYEIFSGNVPFHTVINEFQVMSKIVAGRRPTRPVVSEPSKRRCEEIGLDDYIWKFIENCWTAEPQCRPTAHEAIQRLPIRKRRMGSTTSEAIFHPRISEFSTVNNFVSWAVGFTRTRIKPDTASSPYYIQEADVYYPPSNRKLIYPSRWNLRAADVPIEYNNRDIIQLLTSHDPAILENASVALEIIASGSPSERQSLVDEDIIQRLTRDSDLNNRIVLALVSTITPKLVFDYVQARKIDSIIALIDHKQQQICDAARKSIMLVLSGRAEERACLRNALLPRLSGASDALRELITSCLSQGLARDLVVDGDFIQVFHLLGNEDPRIRAPLIIELRNHIQTCDKAHYKRLLDSDILSSILQMITATTDDLITLITHYILPILGPVMCHTDGGASLFPLLTHKDPRLRYPATTFVRNTVDSHCYDIEKMTATGIISYLYPLIGADVITRDLWCCVLPKAAQFISNRTEVDILFESLGDRHDIVRQVASKSILTMAGTSEVTRLRLFPTLIYLLHLDKPPAFVLNEMAQVISLSGSTFVSNGDAGELVYLVQHGLPLLKAAAVEAIVQVLSKGNPFEQQKLMEAGIFPVAIELNNDPLQRQLSFTLLYAMISYVGHDIELNLAKIKDSPPLNDGPVAALSQPIYQSLESMRKSFISELISITDQLPGVR